MTQIDIGRQNLQAVQTNMVNEKNPQPLENRRSFDALDGVAIVLITVAIVTGLGFWKPWIQKIDQRLCTLSLVIGLALFIATSDLGRVVNKYRNAFSWTAWGLASAGMVGNLVGFSFHANLVLSLIVVGWIGFRIISSSVAYAAFVGFLLLAPCTLEFFVRAGWLDWITKLSSELTVRLLDTFGVAIATEGNSIWTEIGVANPFGNSGDWDSLITVLGFATGLLFIRHANLVTSIFTILLTPPTWIACRGGTTALAIYVSVQSGQWMVENVWWSILAFALEILSVFGICSLFHQVFRPLPIEAFNSEAPTPCYLWNWFCYLPTPIYRVPESSVVAERWRSALKLAHKENSLSAESNWLAKELMTLTNPVLFCGGIIDVFRGWMSTRNWKIIVSCSLALFAPFLCLGLGIGTLQQGESTAQFLSDASENICKTNDLELAATAFLEPEFAKATLPLLTLATPENKSISESVKKHVALFSNRVIDLNPKQPLAHYRRALVNILNDNLSKAIEELKQLADGRYGNYPAGNAWWAKLMIIQRLNDPSVDLREVIAHVEKGADSPKIDGRLLRDYSKILESQGNIPKAISIAIKATKVHPDLILDLAQLYFRTKNEALKETAETAENYFRKRINTSNEREIDRIAVANACNLVGEIDRAVEVLEEAINNQTAGPMIRRELSEMYRWKYRKTQTRNEDKTFSANFELLEKALDMDPTNPAIASEVAQMLPLKLEPSEKLLSALRNQIDQGLSTAGTHLLIAEAYYDKGNLQEAQKQWKIAIDKDPNNAMALNNYAYCLAHADPPNLAQAMEILNRALELAPRNAHILDTIGGVLIQMQKYKDAINKLEAAISLETDFISPRKKLVDAYRQAGMSDMAEHQERVLHEMESKKK